VSGATAGGAGGASKVGGNDRSLPLLIVLLQLMTSLVVAAGLALADNSEAMAALMAGAVCVVPGGFFAWRAAVERSPGRLLGQGIMKFLLTVTSMALVFVAFEPEPLVFFGTLVLMQTMYVAGPVVFGAINGRHTN
jgi:F0F1-type ATP synthase assembly protein I